MPCFHPLKGWRSKKTNPSGKRGIVFKEDLGIISQPMEVPCGQCVGCRLERSRQWAMRCVHEASQHDRNTFITLTYAPDHLPEDGSLKLEHFQKFMKRFRDYKSRKVDSKKVKFYHCGEYGELNGRPHYHALIFGYQFPDLVHWKTRNGIPYFNSDILSKLWPFGFNTVGEVTFESAAYCARYILKKVNGDAAESHYANIDKETGEYIGQKKPEYTTMSKGVGKSWFEQYKDEVYPHDQVIMRGKRMKPPKYYDSILEQEHEEMFNRIKEERKARSIENRKDNTPSRLHDKETVCEARTSFLKRGLEQ